jgi:hypothetical protein
MVAPGLSSGAAERSAESTGKSTSIGLAAGLDVPAAAVRVELMTVGTLAAKHGTKMIAAAGSGTHVLDEMDQARELRCLAGVTGVAFNAQFRNAFAADPVGNVGMAPGKFSVPREGAAREGDDIGRGTVPRPVLKSRGKPKIPAKVRAQGVTTDTTLFRGEGRGLCGFPVLATQTVETRFQPESRVRAVPVACSCIVFVP